MTTRLMSTSGAGVGAILFNEASMLNPASIAFYNNSALYYQKSLSSLASKSSNREQSYDEGVEETFIISDTSSALNGTFSYQHTKENNIRTKRYASSLSSPISGNSALGFIFSYYDVFQASPKKRLFTQIKTDLGYTYIYSEKITFGAVLTDIGKADAENQVLLGGFQLEISENLHILLDAGFNPKYSIEKRSLHKAALQISFFANTFIRAGTYYDKSTNLEGHSWGFSWVGPKLSLDYAFLVSSPIDHKTSTLYNKEQIHQHSLALAVRF